MNSFKSSRRLIASLAVGILLAGGLSVPGAAAGTIVTGPEAGLLPVRVFPEASSLFPYGPSYAGGVRVASGDVNNDGILDVITGTGAGVAGHVKAFNGISSGEIRSFLPYAGFTGGVTVAAGDVNGDSSSDIITGAGSGAPGGHVKVFDGQTGAEIRSFFAFDGFSGGVTVAGGDVNGDGRADIIVGAGPGSPGGHVKVFDGTTGALGPSFFAYTGFTGGVFVASGDVNGDSYDDIITGTDSGAAGHVKVFDGLTLAELDSFFAYGPSFTGGVRVAAGDVNGDGRADIITGAGAGAPGGHVRVFDGTSGAELQSFFAYDVAFTGGVYVASIPEPQSVMLIIAAAVMGTVAVRRRLRRN